MSVNKKELYKFFGNEVDDVTSAIKSYYMEAKFDFGGRVSNSNTMLMPKELKYASISGGVALFGLIFGWVLFPVILKSQLKKEMALSKKTDVRKMWEKIPFPLDFKVYIFNYTNPEEVMKGATPIVKEIGPFHFEEWKEKVEVEDHEEDDTVSYKMIDAFYFNPELSGPGLTGEEIITIPHVFMLGLGLSVAREKPAMLNMVGKALNGIFDNPPDLFLRAKVLDLLFRGIMINCARTEFAPKAVCTQMKKEAINGLVLEANSQFRFSLFGAKNNTVDPHVVTVKRGMKNVMDVGTVVAIDGETQQKVWRDSCNGFGGTDGTVFPPFLTEDGGIQSFSLTLCRSFKLRYQKKTSYAGIKTNRYITNIGDLSHDPELQCLCDAPDICPPKGLMDLYKCLGVPMQVSMPHFLDCDTGLIQRVKGLNPDVSLHGMEFDFEPISGTPLVAKQRVQFNIELMKTDKIELFKDLPGNIAPLFWIEEGYSMNKTFTKMLKHQLFIPKRIVNVLRWWMLSFGGLGTMVGILYHFRDKIMRMAVAGDANVTKVTPEDEEQKDISVIGQAQEPAKINM